MYLIASIDKFNDFIKTKTIYVDDSRQILDYIFCEFVTCNAEDKILSDDDKKSYSLRIDCDAFTKDFIMVDCKHAFHYDITKYVTELHSFRKYDLASVIQFNTLFPHIEIMPQSKFIPHHEDEIDTIPDCFKQCGNKYPMSLQ